MAGFEAKAKAIWSALDQMADKNPGMYKQFINDQLNGEGAQEMMKQLNLGPEMMAATLAGSKSTNRKMATSGDKSHKTVKPVSITTTTKTCSVLTTSSGRMATTTTMSSSDSAKQSGQNCDNGTTTMVSNSLLDDTFAQPSSNLLLNPFLAQIVPNDDEEEDEDHLMMELRLPEEKGNGDGKKGSKPHKVLIEEI